MIKAKDLNIGDIVRYSDSYFMDMLVVNVDKEGTRYLERPYMIVSASGPPYIGVERLTFSLDSTMEFKRY